MLHTATTPDRDDTEAPRSVANPRRTRLGADGRPLNVPAAPSAAE
ncbi:hypothetical protein Kisp02_45500 [Kineosporia sp. NBRC 101731]|nr:hypothetical protein Kisp02_45500 [Kineosporia sp. NBRC 101731]